MTRLSITFSLLFVCAHPAAAETVFVTAQAANKLVSAGALVLDARGKKARSPFLPGAVPIDWMDLRASWGRSGRLANPARLRKSLEAIGVSSKQAIVVYGRMNAGWGEEGRIWWMLRYLGHPKVRILDGGVRAWKKAGLPLSVSPGQRQRGRFAPSPVKRLRANWRTVDRRIQTQVIAVDTRTAAEFRGKTPYLAKRGGHVPGAIHFHWKRLIGRDGTLRRKAKIRALLAKAGIKPAAAIAAYCTGGVRSAFFVAALIHAGYRRVANYDGSWWDWSARSQLPVAH